MLISTDHHNTNLRSIVIVNAHVPLPVRQFALPGHGPGHVPYVGLLVPQVDRRPEVDPGDLRVGAVEGVAVGGGVGGAAGARDDVPVGEGRRVYGRHGYVRRPHVLVHFIANGVISSLPCPRGARASSQWRFPGDFTEILKDLLVGGRGIGLLQLLIFVVITKYYVLQLTDIRVYTNEDLAKAERSKQKRSSSLIFVVFTVKKVEAI